MKKQLCLVLVILLVFTTMSGFSLFGKSKSKEVTVTSITGTAGVKSSEDIDKLVDLNENSKWTVTEFQGAYAIWSYSDEIKPTGYTVVTGNDNSLYKGRNPKTWTLYGSDSRKAPDKDSRKWELLDSITDDTVLRDVNYTRFHFDLAEAKDSYRHFMLVISETRDSTVMQMSEFILEYEGQTNAEGVGKEYVQGGVDPVTGSITISDGGEYSLIAGDSVTLYYSRMPITAYYAYYWTADSGGESIEMDPDGPTCRITGLKPGKVTLRATLESSEVTFYYVQHYTKEYTITVHVVEDVGQKADKRDVTNGLCPRCHGVKTIGCSACFGDGKLDGGKTCGGCTKGRVTCTFCKGTGTWK